MTLARACGVVINGVEGLVVDIEAYLSQGLPGMAIVGLPDTAVGEARDRVRAAVQNSELAIHFGAEIDFLDLQAALTLLEIRKVVALSNQGWKLI